MFPDVLDRVKSIRHQPLENTKSQDLADQLSAVLSDPHLDDTTKMKRYLWVLQRYIVFYAKAKEPPQIISEMNSDAQQDDKDTFKRTIADYVIESLPPDLSRVRRPNYSER